VRVKPNDAPTVKAKRSTVILVVGFDPAFVRRCNEAAAAAHATVVGVEHGAESTFAMQTLPIAVVMQSDAARTSPLGAIARELGIELIALADDTVPDARLRELINGAVMASQRRTRPLSR
jgi:hypothetical protein